MNVIQNKPRANSYWGSNQIYQLSSMPEHYISRKRSRNQSLIKFLNTFVLHIGTTDDNDVYINGQKSLDVAATRRRIP